MSANVKWKVKKSFSEGRPWNVIVYGYRAHDGIFEVEPGEAAVVKRIFCEYLSGKGITSMGNIKMYDQSLQKMICATCRKIKITSVSFNAKTLLSY